MASHTIASTIAFHNQAARKTLQTSTSSTITQSTAPSTRTMPIPPSLSDGPPLNYQPTAAYAYRMPSQPQVSMPSPMAQEQGREVEVGPAFSDPDPDTNVDFLLNGTQQRLRAPPMGLWQYPDRRKAQCVLPFMFLGPSSAARDTHFLVNEGITLLVGVGMLATSHTLLAPVKNAAAQLGIEYCAHSVTSPQELIAQFAPLTRVINAHLVACHRGGGAGKVFVFCESGNQRSASLVASYLMGTFQGVDHLKAMQLVVSRRFCCDFDESSRQMLRNYNDILVARRMMTGQNGGAVQNGITMPLARKRGLEEEEESDDMEMDGKGPSRPYAPFES